MARLPSAAPYVTLTHTRKMHLKMPESNLRVLHIGPEWSHITKTAHCPGPTLFPATWLPHSAAVFQVSEAQADRTAPGGKATAPAVEEEDRARPASPALGAVQARGREPEARSPRPLWTSG